MKLLCLVAVVGCLLVPPAQANKVREVGQLHLVALAPGLLGCHRDSQSATLTPPPPEDPPWGRGPYLGQAAGLPKGCSEHRIQTKLALGGILRKQESLFRDVTQVLSSFALSKNSCGESPAQFDNQIMYCCKML